MINWFNSLDVWEKIFAVIAIPSTLVLLVQTVLSMVTAFGGDGDTDADGDVDGCDCDGDGLPDDIHDGSHEFFDDGLRIFTVRGIIAFFCIFGWSGLLFLRSGLPMGLAVTIAVAFGVIFMFIMAFIFAQFLKLQSNGAMDIKTAIGVSGTVYIPVPAARQGFGKVSAVVAGRFAEFNAVTDEPAPLTTGTQITVVSITGGDTLVVVKK